MIASAEIEEGGLIEYTFAKHLKDKLLPPTDRAKLATWLARKEAQDWDVQMDEDSVLGKLDFLFEEAESERRAGKLKDWPTK